MSTPALATPDAIRVAIADALRPLADPVEIQSAAAAILGRYLRAGRVAYFEVRGDAYYVARDYVDGVAPLAGAFPIAQFGRRLVETLSSGGTAVAPDVANDPELSAAERAAYAAIQIGSHVGVPLIKAGTLVAGLSVQHPGPRQWTADDISLIEDTAERTWAAVERARAAQALRESEEKFRSLFESIDQGVCLCQLLVDQDGTPYDYRFLEVNPMFEQQSGLTNPVGRTALELVPNLERHWIDRYARVALTGEPTQFEEGSAAMGRWFDVRAYRTGDPAKRTFAILFQDITARRTAETLLAKAVADLQESKLRFDIVKDGAQVGFWFCDLPFDILVWDNRVKEHFWFPPDTVVTIDLFYDRLHPDDRERTRQAIEGSIANRTQYDIEYRTVAPDGRHKWIRAMGRTFYDADGGPIRFDGVTVDITHQKHAEEALIEADRRKDEFLAMLAHELRNPLAPIRHAAQVLKLTGTGDPTQQMARDVIERQTQHIARLVDDLLDVSRITQGKIALRPELLDLSSIIDQALEVATPPAKDRGQTITVTKPAGPLLVEGDATRLVQVLSNLLNNATKFTGVGGEVRVTAEAADGRAVIHVSDNGIGISPDLMPRVFDLFTQADRTLDRSQGGLGIGLTLVRLLVGLHGGSVEAHSEGVGRGSDFVVRLPLAIAAADAVPAVEDRSSTPPAAGARRVLIIEDSPDSAEMLSLMLTLKGYETEIAYDGPAAIEAARRSQPDVILCDIGLPRMSGYEVAQRLRAEHAGRPMRLVALTGYGRDQDRRRATEAGFDHHFVKPVQPHLLFAMLESTAD